MKRFGVILLLGLAAAAIFAVISDFLAQDEDVEIVEQDAQASEGGGISGDSPAIDRLLAVVPGYPRDLASKLIEDYGHTAMNVARDHGSVGLDGLRVLGTEGVELMRSQPDTFRLIAERLGSERGLRLLALLQDDVVEVARRGGLPKLIDRIQKLSGDAARLGDSHPQLLPLLVLAPEPVADVVRHHPDIAPQCLMVVDLSNSPEGVVRMCELIEKHAEPGRRWFEARGVDGLLLAAEFPELIGHEPEGPLTDFLQILRTNSIFIKSLAPGEHRLEALTAINALFEAEGHLPSVGEGDPIPTDGQFRGLLTRLACEDPYTVRFVTEHGGSAIAVMTTTAREWAEYRVSVPRLLYDAYDPSKEPEAHANAWKSLLSDSERRAALFALQAFAPWPELSRDDRHPLSEEFLSLLRSTDSRLPAWAAENERQRMSDARSVRASADEEWQKMLKRGLDYLNECMKNGSEIHEYLPLYDSCRLLWVLGKGYTPTTGELVFAAIDGPMTALDVISIIVAVPTGGSGTVAIQTAKEGVRQGVKGAFKTGIKQIAKEAIERTGREVTEAALKRTQNGILAAVARSPTWARGLAATGKKQAATGLEIMARGAAAVTGAEAFSIPLRIGKYVITESAIAVGVSEGIEHAMLFAAQNRNEVVVKQVFEAIEYLNSDPQP